MDSKIKISAMKGFVKLQVSLSSEEIKEQMTNVIFYFWAYLFIHLNGKLHHSCSALISYFKMSLKTNFMLHSFFAKLLSDF